MKKAKNKTIVNQTFDESSLNYETLKIDLELIDCFSRVFGCKWFVYDFFRNKIIETNLKNSFFLEIKNTENQISDFIEKICDSETDYFINLIERALKHIKTFDADLRKNIILNLKCHLKNENNILEMYDLKIIFTHFDNFGHTWFVSFVFGVSERKDYIIPYLSTNRNEKISYNLNPKVLEKLTETEQKIAHLCWDNATNKQIAEIMSTTENTVKSHISNIRKKLEVNNKFEMQRTLLLK